MAEVDLEPDEYRKQDPRTGRWLENVDRKFCRWMALVALGVLAFVTFTAGQYAHPVFMVAAGFLGFCAGGLFIMSLKTLDW